MIPLTCPLGDFDFYEVPDPPEPQPEQPTDALPGSDAKIEVLRRRALNDEPLWHRLDPVDDRIDRRDLVLSVGGGIVREMPGYVTDRVHNCRQSLDGKEEATDHEKCGQENHPPKKVRTEKEDGQEGQNGKAQEVCEGIGDQEGSQEEARQKTSHEIASQATITG